MSKKSRPSAQNPGWFPKGRSPNPHGRPRSVPNSPAFEILVEKTMTVMDRGRIREISLEEALQLRTCDDALAGKPKAMREVVKWIAKREAWRAKQAAKKTRQAITRLQSPDPDNADAALVLLGIAVPDPNRESFGEGAQLLLEPFWVQAALRRRRGGNRLTGRERDEIRRCTRDRDSLRWPRGTDE